MPVRLTQAQFLERLPKDIKFKPVEKINNIKDPVVWECDAGHSFSSPLRNLIRRPICPVCDPPISNKKYTIDEVVNICDKHGYTFNDDFYGGNKHFHSMTCKKCGYTKDKRINSVVSGSGCLNCSSTRPLTWEIVRDKAAEKGIEVPRCEIVNSRSKISVVCNNAGVPHEYEVTPGHIMMGIGCPICADRYKLTVEDVNLRLGNRGIKFRLVSDDYKNNKTFYPFECTVCGYTVETTYNRVCRRTTCPICDPRYAYGEFPDKPHKLYYLRVESEYGTLYKIGITSKPSITKRFSGRGDLDKITVLRVIELDTGQKAFDLEQYYLRLFHQYRYSGTPILKSGGNTELFTNDILGLDTLNQKPL